MSKKNLAQVMKAIDYIEANLSEKLDLGIIARAVNYSKYHLHRMFTHAVGLTMHDYIQRRQLTEGAKLLVFSNKPILDIALLAGYESQQAFTNIFTTMYKQPPKKYRLNKNFYPLQLKYEFQKCLTIDAAENKISDIVFAKAEDIPHWMDLVRLVIDGFPNLQETEYIATLREQIKAKQALILKEQDLALGVMIFSRQTGNIEFFAVHPLYHQTDIPRKFLDKVGGELLSGQDISITTYREGDKADTGHRQKTKALGFAEAELLTEFGYPTQRFILPRAPRNKKDSK